MNRQVIETLPVNTVVEILGVLEETGETIISEFVVQHPNGLPDADIVATAWNQFKQVGGMLKNEDGGGMAFYMASKFKAPFIFRTRKILVAH